MVNNNNNNNNSNSYKEALKIFNSLSEKEKWQVCPKRGIYIDSKFLLYRHVIPSKAFIDLYPNNNNKKEGFIIIAVNPNHRHQHLTSKLIDKCIDDITKTKSNSSINNIKRLIWKCNSTNESSYRAALKNNFKLKSLNNNEYVLYRDIQ